MKWIDRLSLFVGESVSWFYLIAATITVFEVVMRYVFNAPTVWAHELTILLCAVGYLLSSGYITQREAHIRITVLYDYLPMKARLMLDGFAALFGLAVMGLFLYAAWGQGALALKVWERTGSAWDPPLYAITKPAIVVGAALICLQNIALCAKLWRRFRAEV